MDKDEFKRFYKSDEIKYKLGYNPKFIEIFSFMKNNGYCTNYEIDDLQRLVDFLANWFEIKYPNRFFDKENGVIDKRFINNQDNVLKLTIDDLLYQLPNNLLSILDCNYKGNSYNRILVVDDNGNVVDTKISSMVRIKQKVEGNISMLPSINISFNPQTGMIYEDFGYEEYFNDKETIFSEILELEDINLSQLYTYLTNKYADELDLSDLENILLINKYDKKLRKYLLYLVSLKILYSRNTTPEYGYLRAKKFVEDITLYYLANKNEKLYLHSDELDEIINNYRNSKVKSKTKHY